MPISWPGFVNLPGLILSFEEACRGTCHRNSLNLPVKIDGHLLSLCQKTDQSLYFDPGTKAMLLCNPRG